MSSLTPVAGRMALIEIRTGADRHPIDLDSTDRNASPLPAGWVWIRYPVVTGAT